MAKFLSRRTLLRGATGGMAACIGLPALEAMLNTHGTAYASGEGFPQRFGVWFWGVGVILPEWVPMDTGPDWTPGPGLEAIEAAGVKDYVSVVSGTQIKFLNQAVHDVGRAAMLSGSWDINAPTAGLIGNATLPSLDQIAADHLQGPSPFRSLEVGVSQTGFGMVQDTDSVAWVDPINLLPAEMSPAALFDRVFSGGVEPDTRYTDSRLSVLDVVLQDAKALKKKLGSNDKARLDQHLDAIRQLETRLSNTPPPCVLPQNPGDFPPIGGQEQLTEISTAMSDLLAIALACDMTRVFNFRFTQYLADTFFPQVGLTEGYHTTSHILTEQAQIALVVRYLMQNFAYTLQKLAELEEGQGTVLDNCCILGTSELAEGYSHEITDMPVLVAGRACGNLRSGIHYRSATLENASNVGLTLLKAVGVPVTSFGELEGYTEDTISAIEA